MNKGREVNIGLYTHQILMADILAFDFMCAIRRRPEAARRDGARHGQRFDHLFGETRIPAQIRDVATVPGLTLKMSKSYVNTIEIFLPPKKLRKDRHRRIRRGSRSQGPDRHFVQYKLFATPEQQASLPTTVEAGHGHVKQALLKVADAQLAEARERYDHPWRTR